MRRYVCVDDVGKVVNPLIVEGQVHGGLAQGIAQALFEEADYDEQGTLVTGTFVDYTLPSAADLPSFTTDRTETPATTNPLGVKGVGEAGTIASTPAIVNGVLDAMRHLGVTDIEMPCTPQRVWRAIQDGAGPCHAGDAGRHPLAGRRPRLDRPEQPAGRRGPVIPAPFDYVRPGTVDEAVAALGQAGEDAQDPRRRAEPHPGAAAAAGRAVHADRPRRDPRAAGHPRRRRPDRDRGDGAAPRRHARRRWSSEHVALLAQATATVADNQVRHRGTLGGALAHADPAGDLGGVALALEAEFVDRRAGRHAARCRADEFFVDYFTTALGEDEILTEVRFPKYTGWGSHYEKFNRTAQSWSMVAIAAAVRVEGGTIAEARVGLTNMGPTPMRARGVEEALVGQPATAEAVRAAAQRVTEGTAAPSDADAAADYREHLARVLTGRAVLAAAGSTFLDRSCRTPVPVPGTGVRAFSAEEAA